jgi:hypothetical protein
MMEFSLSRHMFPANHCGRPLSQPAQQSDSRDPAIVPATLSAALRADCAKMQRSWYPKTVVNN